MHGLVLSFAANMHKVVYDQNRTYKHMPWWGWGKGIGISNELTKLQFKSFKWSSWSFMGSDTHWYTSFCAWWLVVLWGQMYVIWCLKKRSTRWPFKSFNMSPFATKTWTWQSTKEIFTLFTIGWTHVDGTQYVGFIIKWMYTDGPYLTWTYLSQVYFKEWTGRSTLLTCNARNIPLWKENLGNMHTEPPFIEPQ